MVKKHKVSWVYQPLAESLRLLRNVIKYHTNNIFKKLMKKIKNDDDDDIIGINDDIIDINTTNLIQNWLEIVFIGIFFGI